MAKWRIARESSLALRGVEIRLKWTIIAPSPIFTVIPAKAGIQRFADVAGMPRARNVNTP